MWNYWFCRTGWMLRAPCGTPGSPWHMGHHSEGNLRAALGQGQCRFDAKGRWQRVCTGAGGHTPAGAQLWPALPEMLIRQTRVASNSLPRRSLASLSEQSERKTLLVLWNVLCLPSRQGLTGRSRGLQPCHQPPLGVVGWCGHLILLAFCGGHIPLGYGAV